MTMDEMPDAARPPLSTKKTALALAGVLLGVLCIFGVLLWILPDSGRPVTLPESQDAASRRATREALDDAARTKLSTYGWVDKEKGVVRLPVERAAELVIEERRTR